MEDINGELGPSPTVRTNIQEYSHRDRVKAYIDDTLARILDELQTPDGRPSLTLRRRSARSSFFINRDNMALERCEVEAHSIYTWPGRDAYEAWKFSTEFQPLQTHPARN